MFTSGDYVKLNMENSSNNMVDHFLVKKNRGDIWRTLLHSEWFIFQLLSYLWIHDVVELDSAICNHEDREQWLDRLNKTQSSLCANLKQKKMNEKSKKNN